MADTLTREQVELEAIKVVCPLTLQPMTPYEHGMVRMLTSFGLALRGLEQNSAAQVNAADSATHGLPGMSGLPAPADLVARLRAAEPRSRAMLEDADGAIRDPLKLEAADLIERMDAKLREAERDAARYRWLREHPDFLGWEWDFAAEGVDKEIDEAMKK